MARKGVSKTTGTSTKRGRAAKGESTQPEPSRGEAIVGERSTEMDQAGGGTATVSHDDIAQRAKVIWERRGRPHGEDEKNWREAEEELRRERGMGR